MSLKHLIDLALELISKTLKGKKIKRLTLYSSERLCALRKLKNVENVHVFVFLSGKTKQLGLLANYWAVLSILYMEI